MPLYDSSVIVASAVVSNIYTHTICTIFHSDIERKQ
jgi:hypothetical protein